MTLYNENFYQHSKKDKMYKLMIQKLKKAQMINIAMNQKRHSQILSVNHLAE